MQNRYLILLFLHIKLVQSTKHRGTFIVKQSQEVQLVTKVNFDSFVKWDMVSRFMQFLSVAHA